MYVSRRIRGENQGSLKNFVIGKPYSPQDLSTLEHSCLQELNYNVMDLLFYPHLCLVNGSIVSVVSKSKAKKRNNSCVWYLNASGLHQRGICERIFGTKDGLMYYCFVNKLELTADQICKDRITHAQVHNHLVSCNPPRYASLHCNLRTFINHGIYVL